MDALCSQRTYGRTTLKNAGLRPLFWTLFFDGEDRHFLEFASWCHEEQRYRSTSTTSQKTANKSRVMLTSSSRAFSRVLNKRLIASHGRRWISTEALASSPAANKKICFVLSGAVGLGLLMQNEPQYASMAARVPSSGDVLSEGAIVKEEATGIAFPQLCNGMTLCGCGGRFTLQKFSRRYPCT